MGLSVKLPPSARATFDMALANFGEPKYGASLLGDLIYPSSDAVYNKIAYQCYPVPCEYACSPLNASTPPFIINKLKGRHHVMLIDRGPRQGDLKKPCTFLEKIYYAQMAGADAVVYVNDNDGALLTPDSPSDSDLTKLLQDVSIPAGFISQGDGNKLKELLKAGPVTVALNWTDILPRAPQVSWEFWSNSNDECGEICTQQQDFVKAVKSTAQELQRGGHAAFSPHYLLWSCPGQFSGSSACTTQCIRNGTYCCPDPDDNIKEGYSGADVLWMNLRSLCFHRVANASGQPWLWWDYVERVGRDCSMASHHFTPACSDKVFSDVGGEQLLAGKGKEQWGACTEQASTGQGPIQMLEDELNSQHGADGSSSVAILPTIRINGAQYRGSLEASAVVRALCSAFPLDKEPAMCNTEMVSENECKPGGVGYDNCHNGTNSAAGKTECINTFGGYECRCGQGYVKLTYPDSNLEYCADVNECLVTNEPQRMPDCSCERCTCINEKGGFRCSGAIQNTCTAEHNYGGCWHATIDNVVYHSCVDTFPQYRSLAVQGALNASSSAFACGPCPPCFAAAPGGGCVPQCPLKACNPQTGSCVAKRLPSGGGSGSSGGGISGVAVFFIVVVSMAATAGAMLAVYQYHFKRRFREDMRDLMLEYMPLAESDASLAPVRSTPLQP